MIFYEIVFHFILPYYFYFLLYLTLIDIIFFFFLYFIILYYREEERGGGEGEVTLDHRGGNIQLSFVNRKKRRRTRKNGSQR
jgi:hypothetical protein